MTTPLVMTIGHSNHSVERLVDLLRAHEVTAIGDVRSSPYSRQNPDFNREFLQHRLKDSGITYLYLGRELGARPQDPSLYEKGRVQYRKLSRDTLFREGLRQVLLVAQSSRLAL